MDRAVALVVVCGGLGIAACAAEKEPEPAPVVEPASGGERTTQEETLESHMQLNFLLANQMRDALVAGNLPTAQKRANALATYDYSKELPQHWMKDVEKMQTAARSVEHAPDLPTAARSLAALAATCGDCHARLPNRPPDKAEEHGFSAKGPEELSTRMARHARAADDMWFALTLPSDAHWLSAARVLTEAPLSPPEVDGKPVNQATEAKMEAIREIGRRALEAEAQEERVATYGDLVASCIGCHGAS